MSPNWRSRSTSTDDLPSSASATARLDDVTVLPVPPFGPSTVIISPSDDDATAPRLRASAFSNAKPSWPADCGSATRSSAPASNARSRKPFGEPW